MKVHQLRFCDVVYLWIVDYEREYRVTSTRCCRQSTRCGVIEDQLKKFRVHYLNLWRPPEENIDSISWWLARDALYHNSTVSHRWPFFTWTFQLISFSNSLAICPRYSSLHVRKHHIVGTDVRAGIYPIWYIWKSLHMWAWDKDPNFRKLDDNTYFGINLKPVNRLADVDILENLASSSSRNQEPN